MIEVRNLIRVYGDTIAVDDLTFTVRSGLVTGFLGPNGAGKSTTIRLILGRDHPSSGQALISGRQFADHASPWGVVGALPDVSETDPTSNAFEQLSGFAAARGISRRRVAAVLDEVGLEVVAHTRVGELSRGRRQRLGLAYALLADPAVLVLDQPGDGLDAAGLRWLRELLRQLADEGRTVFVSSHVLSEVTRTADQLIVIDRGRLLADVPTTELAAAVPRVRLRSPRATDLAPLLAGPDVVVRREGPETLVLSGLGAAEVAETAFAYGIVLHDVRPVDVSLEEAFLALTEGRAEPQPRK